MPAWTWTLPVRSYATQALVSPRDAASGLPTGKRMHKPMTITVDQGAATPLLSQALKRNDVVTSFTLSFTPVATGGMTHTFTIRDVQGTKLAPSAEYSEVSFTYQKITWTWVEGGKTATDDWEAPAA